MILEEALYQVYLFLLDATRWRHGMLLRMGLDVRVQLRSD